jgi:probable rRNA maturation factor
VTPAPAHTVNVRFARDLPRALRGRLAPALVRSAARAALAHQGAPAPGALTVSVVGDEALRRLNRDYLKQDYATDVLAFPADEADDGARYFGDVALSLPRAAAQARAGGHRLRDEVQLLVVHAVLHLMGHDHAGKRDRARMWAAQAEILTGLSSPVTGPETALRRRRVTKGGRAESA